MEYYPESGISVVHTLCGYITLDLVGYRTSLFMRGLLSRTLEGDIPHFISFVALFCVSGGARIEYTSDSALTTMLFVISSN